jgi:hypothetical protein
VSPRLLAKFMTATYPHLAPASYNRVVATLALLFAYTTRQGWTPTSPATGLERRRPRSDRAAHARARAIRAAELLAFLDADHPLREKTLWWLLDETAARAGEVLALDVADLDLAARRAVVVGTCTAGGPARCSSPTSPPHPPANQPWPTSTPPPAGPGCPTGVPPRYSPRPAAAGPCTSSATPGSPTSPKRVSGSRC